MPRKLIFFCEMPATVHGSRGGNPIMDGRAFTKVLDSAVADKFKSKGGIQYSGIFADAGVDDRFVTWQDSMQTSDRREAEGVLKSTGWDFEWLPDGSLRRFKNMPATRLHPVSGEEVWCNQLTAQHHTYFHSHPTFPELAGKTEYDATFPYPFDTRYGDGSPVEQEVLDYLRGLMWSNSVGFQWEAGDMLIMDNIAVAHARLDFEGDRRMWVSMTMD